jgi:hypothetical protein
MLTTVEDLSRYVGAFLAAGPPRDGPESGPIRRASLREMQQAWRPAALRAGRDPATGALQLTSTAYGFGLRIGSTCDYRLIVAHSGGLPGYGSLMQWLPDYGVGVIAFGNLTYTGWGRVINDVFDRLARTGGLQPRIVRPSKALADARDEVSSLIVNWDDRLADRIAAGNLFLDRSKERRRAEIAQLTGEVGTCTMPSRFDVVENALRGQWTMTCAKGSLEVSITLAPTIPPRVQYLSVRQAPARPAPSGACAQ